MSYLYALLVVLILSVLFVLSYYFNSKVKIDCDNKDFCDSCKNECCYHKMNKED